MTNTRNQSFNFEQSRGVNVCNVVCNGTWPATRRHIVFVRSVSEQKTHTQGKHFGQMSLHLHRTAGEIKVYSEKST